MFDYLLSDEQKKLRDEARDFVKSIPRKMILHMDADKIKFPKEFLQEAGKRNLMGCRYPEKWGGRGMDWVSTCMVMEEIGVLGYIFACTFGVGAELVYARTDHKAPAHKGISCFIVDKTQGVKNQYLYGLMGCRGGGTARMVFKDVIVPKENLLGELNQGVKIFNTMMIPERLGTAAMTIGAAMPALDVATGYTSKRKAFGKPVAAFQGVSFQVAEAITLLDAARAMIYNSSNMTLTSRAIQSPSLKTIGLISS